MRLLYGRSLPLWYAEGMASYFETLAYDPVNGQLMFGRATLGRVHSLREKGPLLPIEKLVDGGFDDTATSNPGVYYARCWLLTHALIHGAAGVLERFDKELLAGIDGHDAWARATGTSPVRRHRCLADRLLQAAPLRRGTPDAVAAAGRDVHAKADVHGRRAHRAGPAARDGERHPAGALGMASRACTGGGALGAGARPDPAGRAADRVGPGDAAVGRAGPPGAGRPRAELGGVDGAGQRARARAGARAPARARPRTPRRRTARGADAGRDAEPQRAQGPARARRRRARIPALGPGEPALRTRTALRRRRAALRARLCLGDDARRALRIGRPLAGRAHQARWAEQRLDRRRPHAGGLPRARPFREAAARRPSHDTQP